MQMCTVKLRIVIGSRNFDMRRQALDRAIDVALTAATGALSGAGFREIESEAEIVGRDRRPRAWGE